MGNVKLTMVIMLQALLAFCLFGYANNALADGEVLADKAGSSRHQVELIRDPDYKCVQCHKDSKHTLSASHGEKVIEKFGKPANCTDCHGNIGPDHREGASTVNKFSAAQSQQGTEKYLLPQDHILKANQQCMDCHTPDDLRAANWTHDVHAKNLTCSNCHTVHEEKGKVLSLDSSARIKMCVDCHKDFNHKRVE